MGLLEYSFGEHGFVLPKTFDAFRQTLIGPGSVRLVAPTGAKSFANLRVHRANGRDHIDLNGGAASDSQPPAIVSIPKQQTVVLGGKTTLFVSASGDNLTYQWKKDGQSISGATSAITFNEARPQDSGNYTVVVGNTDGNVTSSVAQLVVDTLMKTVQGGTYRINADPDNAGHEVALSTYMIDMFEVRMSYWEEVYEWATQNGYAFTNPGLNTDSNGNPQSGDHPVHSISWYDAVKWANARSEKDGFAPCYYADENHTTVYRSGEINLTNFHVDWTASGYRLPTEAEWEVAARGGLVANKYAWEILLFPVKQIMLIPALARPPRWVPSIPMAMGFTILEVIYANGPGIGKTTGLTNTNGRKLLESYNVATNCDMKFTIDESGQSVKDPSKSAH